MEGLREAVSDSVRRGDTASATRYAGMLKEMQSSADSAKAAEIKAAALLKQQGVTNAQAASNEDGRNRRATEKATRDERAAAIKHLNSIAKVDLTAENARLLAGLKNSMRASEIQTRHANALDMLDEKDVKGQEKEKRKLDAEIAKESRRLEAEIAKEERAATTWSAQRARAHEDSLARINLNNLHKAQDVTMADGKLIKLLLQNTNDPVVNTWLEANDSWRDWGGINDDAPVWQKLTTLVVKEKAKNGGDLDTAIRTVIKGL